MSSVAFSFPLVDLFTPGLLICKTPENQRVLEELLPFKMGTGSAVILNLCFSEALS